MNQKGIGFREKLGFRDQSVEFKIREFGIQGSGFRVQGSGFRVQGSGFRVQG